ncbi:hypothetical protein [Rhodococcus sp. T7]|uniref:hypothetical protein n=1 Tax=Rhodococcus sp. T7 TaxID=627444 RepID=UPI001358D346|nr:hypothetical protein [Rhodococcus sp. T7]KAF0957736.1 hypothetical protein MLGJGCBP_09568 [Rhodococcus sp. T7]KAF0965431.1 hypothetical protein MLGJGCBP_01398 [Rhodococcus sp. T7]
MQRSRTIAGSPVRTAAEAWGVVVQLVADTIEKSSEVPEGSVAASLNEIQGIGAALVAGGHLDSSPLVLVDESLYVCIRIVRGDNAFTLDETLDPIPGGASATAKWLLYIPAPAHLADHLRSAAASSDHVSTAAAPAYQEKAQAALSASIDHDALRGLGGS